MVKKRFTINDCRVLSNEQTLKILNSLVDENEQLKKENQELKLLVQDWEALDEEKDEELDGQNQALKKLKKENKQLKSKNQNLRKCINEIYIISSRESVE